MTKNVNSFNIKVKQGFHSLKKQSKKHIKTSYDIMFFLGHEICNLQKAYCESNEQTEGMGTKVKTVT